MEDLWSRVFNSGVRRFDEPGRSLLQTELPAEFTSALLRAVAELAAWEALEGPDLDNPDDRARLVARLAEVDYLLGVLRVGVREATVRAEQNEGGLTL